MPAGRPTWKGNAAVVALLAAGGMLAAQPPGQPAAPARIVFIGDSITDGHTYPQLVQQALARAGRARPICINAAVAGNTVAQMRKRLQRDVLPRRPTLATLNAGVNDAFAKVDPGAYEADVEAIAARLRAEKIDLVLLTASILGPKHAEAETRLTAYNARLRKVAAKYRLRLADVFARMVQARAAGQELLETDQVHPNFEGQRLIARAVLDALGHKDVAVPPALELTPLPGLVRHWKVRAAPDGKPLTPAAVAALRPDGRWKALTLPEDRPAATWWLDHERQRGFAVGLEKLAGPGRRFQAVAEINSPAARTVYLNTGAQLEAVWLNGKRLFQAEGWTGWHAGKERLRAELAAGRNVIVLETGGPFFLSVTDDDRW